MNELRKIIVSSDFNDKINDLQKSRMSFLSNQPNQSNFDFTYDTFPPNGKITLAEEFTNKVWEDDHHTGHPKENAKSK